MGAASGASSLTGLRCRVELRRRDVDRGAALGGGARSEGGDPRGRQAVRGAVPAAADEEHARGDDELGDARQLGDAARHRDARHPVREQDERIAGGLAAAIARQLERQLGSGAAAALAAPAAARRGRRSGRRAGGAARRRRRRCRRGRSTSSAPTRSAARAAEAASGIPAAFTVAQAAHESGWGKREIRNADGSVVAQPVRHQGRAGLERAGRRDHDDRVRRRRAAEGHREVPRLRVVRATRSATTRRLMKESPRYAGVVAQAAQAPASAASAQASRWACSAPATRPIRPTPTSSRRLINTTLRMQKVVSREPCCVLHCHRSMAASRGDAIRELRGAADDRQQHRQRRTPPATRARRSSSRRRSASRPAPASSARASTSRR